jgi:hypothetical protein
MSSSSQPSTEMPASSSTTMNPKISPPAKSVSYEEYVVRVVSQMTKEKGAIDQLSLRESESPIGFCPVDY